MAKRIEEEFTCCLDRGDVPACEVVPVNIPTYSQRNVVIEVNSVNKAQFLFTLLNKIVWAKQLSDVEMQYVTYLRNIIEKEC